MSPNDPIAQAIARGAHRDAVALAARTHGAALGRFCMSLLGSQQEAEEVVQETLIAAHDALDAYRGEGSFGAYLFGIARRQCAKRLVKRSRRERRLQLVHDATAAEATPADLLERRQRAVRVRAAVESLKPSEREAVLLRFEADLGYGEIARVMSIEPPAARKRVSRALSRLRDVLTDEVSS